MTHTCCGPPSQLSGSGHDDQVSDRNCLKCAFVCFKTCTMCWFIFTGQQAQSETATWPQVAHKHMSCCILMKIDFIDCFKYSPQKPKNQITSPSSYQEIKTGSLQYLAKSKQHWPPSKTKAKLPSSRNSLLEE